MTIDRARKRAARARMLISGEPFRTAAEQVAVASHAYGVDKLAHIRAAYTGEKLAEASAGVTADRGLGLDYCDPAQLQLRALLALGMFNGGHDMPDSPLGSSNVAGLVTYTITMSPRFDTLVLITNAPDNIARRLVPDQAGNRGVPGMRVERTFRHRTGLLRHLPTGAALVVTARRDVTAQLLHKHAGDEPSPVYGRLTIEHPLTGRERDRIDLTPIPSQDAARLLAALTVRLNLTDPDRCWSTGNFFWDPLNRVPDPAQDLRMSYGARRLTGHHDSWRLAWASYPFHNDLVAALTDPVTGLTDVERRPGNGSALRLASSKLFLDGPVHQEPSAPTPTT